MVVSRFPNYAVYQGHRVLITGGLGFMGVNLAVGLHRVGAQIRLLDIVWPEHSERLSPLLEQVEFIKADLRDEQSVEAAIDGCDWIFDLAGRSGAIASNSSPLDDLDVNCRGQLTLLETCRKHNPRVKIVFPSSRLVYAPAAQLPVAETAPTEPFSIYGIHKLTVEKYLRLYARLYGLRVTILRITNPYGPHQRPEQQRYGIINWFIHLAHSGQAIPIYGDGQQIRDYIHIDDVVQAFLRAGADECANGKVFNVGSGKPIRLVNMAQMIVDEAGCGKVEHIPWPAAAQQSESGDFVADTTLIRETLGWQPQIQLGEGIKQVLGYYRDLYPKEI